MGSIFIFCTCYLIYFVTFESNLDVGAFVATEHESELRVDLTDMINAGCNASYSKNRPVQSFVLLAFLKEHFLCRRKVGLFWLLYSNNRIKNEASYEIWRLNISLCI